ncbi:RNA-processing protein PTA1 [Sporobolomyces salmoneus]|uniref:RNA-processing protein PTA1 n=1 Tax=Sporobolomyces salmoneus TaxID=183962 RepID=UPI00317F1820
MSYYNGAPPPNGAVSPADLTLISSLSSPSTQPALRASAALQAVEPIARILLSPSPPDVSTIKLALSAFATAYPYLFRYACQSGDQGWWTRIVQVKTAILQQWRNGGLGLKVAAVKVIQRIIQTQTNSGATSDPRLARAQAQEPNLSLCRPNHPFLKIALLEEEASKLLEECITTLFTTTHADLVSALTTSLTALVKVRNQFTQLVVTALTNWAPTTLAGQSYSQIKSVEKVIRISLTHLLRTSHASAYHSQINQFLTTQGQRLETASLAERKKREELLSRKRQLPPSSSSVSSTPPAPSSSAPSLPFELPPVGAKRRRLNPGVDLLRAFGAANLDLDANLAATPLATDYSIQVVVDGLMKTFETVPDAVLSRAIEMVKMQLPPSELRKIGEEEEEKPVPTPVTTTAFEEPRPVVPQMNAAMEVEREESSRMLDPLKLDLGEEELSIKAEVPPEPIAEPEPEESNEDATLALSASLLANSSSADFDLEPLDLSQTAKHALVYSTLRRICSAGSDGGVNERIWIPLVSRLITRGLESGAMLMDGEGEVSEEEKDERRKRGEKLREVLFNYVTRDLQARMELARLWLNEEWYASKRLNQTSNRPYDVYLGRFLSHICEISSNQDTALFQFMIDLPEIPVPELERLERMCLNADQMQLGFSTLRELAILRPSVRRAALDVLLGLTTHADKRIRNAAIMSVKKWVPDVKELSGIIVGFALSLLERLQAEPVKEEEGVKEEDGTHDPEGEEEMAMEETPPPEEPKPPYAIVKEGKVVDRLDPPKTIGEVTQHVELLLALCVKEPELLDPLFAEYARMAPFARESMPELISPLIRSLGIKHPGILHIFGHFPPGSDALLLKTIEILADKQKLPTNMVQLIKNVAAERDLDSKIYALIMPDCHKDEIIRYLPRVVALLDNTAQQKAAIRSIFLSIIAPPAHFSSVNSLRTRSDSLTPVELIVFLHKHDKEIGIKQTIEAIAICFSMADAFRPEILAAFMQQIVDEPVLPNLFLRTVIQAVTTYKSLQPFVSTTLLSRLIAKKIWETPALWEGFIRCAKAIAPASFAALLQLPKEWLEDLVKKQPAMRTPLREYVVKKGGIANAKTTAILEALEDPKDPSTAAATPRSESPAVLPTGPAAEASPSVNVVV